MKLVICYMIFSKGKNIVQCEIYDDFIFNEHFYYLSAMRYL